MRLFLLPISTRRTLIYCQRLNKQLTTEQTYVEKVTSRASTTWGKWEAAEKGWQKQVTQWGNQLFKRIPYEEWGLKSIPPLSTRRKSQELEGKEDIELLYPPTVIKPTRVLDVLEKLATERQALHKKWMYGSIIGMPITIPFGLIPVLPNLPFFYLVFRAWSHWRALSGSKHIQFLVENGLIKATAGHLLDECYFITRTQAFSNKIRQDIDEIDKGLKRLDQHDATCGVDASKDFHETRESHIGSKKLEKNFETIEKNTEGIAQPEGGAKPPVKPLVAEQWDAWNADFEDEGLVPDVSPPNGDAAKQPAEKMLLSKGNGALIAGALQVRELEVEIERAIQQVKKVIASKVELAEESKELAKATARNKEDAKLKKSK